MPGAGDLDRTFRFEKRQEVEDGYGNTVDQWMPQFTARGMRAFLRGGESIIASRLEGRQPAILTIRNHAAAREITNDWRAVDVFGGNDEFGVPKVAFNIRENPKLTDDRLFLEMLVESGVAT